MYVGLLKTCIIKNIRNIPTAALVPEFVCKLTWRIHVMEKKSCILYSLCIFAATSSPRQKADNAFCRSFGKLCPPMQEVWFFLFLLSVVVVTKN